VSNIHELSLLLPATVESARDARRAVDAMPFEAEAFAARIDERIVAPRRDLQNAMDTLPWLTRRPVRTIPATYPVCSLGMVDSKATLAVSGCRTVRRSSSALTPATF